MLFILSLFLCSRTEFSSAGTRKAFREIRSQKCMWVNNALQFWKGHSWSSTEINIIGVWEAMLSVHGEADGDKLPPGPRLGGRSLLTTCQELLNDIFASLLQLTCWLNSPALPPLASPLQAGNKPHLCQKSFELFPSWAIPEYKTCSEKLHRSLEKFYDLVTAACAAPWPEEPWVPAKQWSNAIISFPIQWRQSRLCFYFQTVLL